MKATYLLQRRFDQVETMDAEQYCEHKEQLTLNQ